MASTIKEIENAMITTLEASGVFKYVGSIGRDGRPAAINYPAAMVFFNGESDTGNNPRPVRNASFLVAVLVRNLTGEKEAAQDAYDILDTVRDLFLGQTIGLSGIGAFACPARKFGGYANGVVTYLNEFTCKVYLNVP